MPYFEILYFAHRGGDFRILYSRQAAVLYYKHDTTFKVFSLCLGKPCFELDGRPRTEHFRNARDQKLCVNLLRSDDKSVLQVGT